MNQAIKWSGKHKLLKNFNVNVDADADADANADAWGNRRAKNDLLKDVERTQTNSSMPRGPTKRTFSTERTVYTKSPNLQNDKKYGQWHFPGFLLLDYILQINLYTVSCGFFFLFFF